MHFYEQLLLISWLTLGFVEAQVALFNLSSTTPGLSSTCIQVINQAVNCNTTLLSAGLNGRLETDATLASVCTAACTYALTTWQRRVSGACGTQRYQSGDGFMVLGEYLTEVYLERYNSLCLKDPSGNFCNAVIRSALGVNPLNQQQTASAIPSIACNDCILRLAQTQLEMPLSSNSILSSHFSSVTSSCKKTGYAVVPATTTSTQYRIPLTAWTGTIVSGQTASATPTGCLGTTYTIKSGDTCQSISLSQGISTANLVSVNGLIAYCRNFPTAGTLCIPTSSKCTAYTVQANDTCASVATAHSVFWAQIVSWNPDVGLACNNLTRTHLGLTLCVSPPGGAWTNPVAPPTTTTVTAPNTIFTLGLSPFSAYSFAQQTFTSVLNYSTGPLQGDPYSTPYANGTRQDCATYVTGSSLYNLTNAYLSNATATPITSCTQIASGYGVQLSDFISWNPSLNNTLPCVLNANLQYCAQTFLRNTTNLTPYCQQFDMAHPGQDCSTLTTEHRIQLNEFVDWNPSVTIVNDTCSNFATGIQYCVAVSHFRQPGIVSVCNSYVMANQTAWTANSLEPCLYIETLYGLSHARFVAWNPALKNDCSGIRQYYDYCVSIPNYRPTYSSTTQFAEPTRKVPTTTSYFTTTATAVAKIVTSSAKTSSTTAKTSSTTAKTSSSTTAKTSSSTTAKTTTTLTK